MKYENILQLFDVTFQQNNYLKARSDFCELPLLRFTQSVWTSQNALIKRAYSRDNFSKINDAWSKIWEGINFCHNFL